MEFIRNNIYKLFISIRPIVEFDDLLNNFALLNFWVGIVLSVVLTLCYFFTGLVFQFGLWTGIGVGIWIMIEYFTMPCSNYSCDKLKSLRFIEFENTHYITNESLTKCCGKKSQFCGWIFGVTSTHGLKVTSAIRQELHASIMGSKLILLLPSPILKRKHLFNNATISHDVFDYRREVELRNSKIICYPNTTTDTNIWGFKYPIGIVLSDFNKNFSGQIDHNYRWKPIYHDENRSLIESKIKMFQCKTKSSTLEYLRFSRKKLHKIFFCAISCRDKEIWFRYLIMASHGMKVNVSLWKILSPLMNMDHSINHSTDFSSKENKSQMASFVKYFVKYMPADWVLFDHKYPVNLNGPKISCQPNFLWLNAFCARLFWGYMEEGFLVKKIIRKLHNKIKKVKLPIYIEEIAIENVDIGHNMPIINNIERPKLDTNGFWCDIHIEYEGGLSLSLVTKVNLMKLKDQQRKPKKFITLDNIATAFHLPGKEKESDSKVNDILRNRLFRESVFTKFDAPKTTNNSSAPNIHRRSFRFIDRQQVFSDTSSDGTSKKKEAAFDSDEEDSNESIETDSGVEYSIEKTVKKCACFTYEKKENYHTQSMETRILKVIEKLGRSKYFLKATRIKYIKRGIEKFASKKILLQLDIHHFDGVLVIHIPKPPSDRIWYGLRPLPNLKLSTIPKIGDRQLNFSKITDWIQKKVKSEIEQVLVLPNMDDIKIH